MMKLSSFAGSVVVAFACAVPLLSAGCGSDFGGEPGPSVEKTGTLTAALQASTPDGATYRFVDGSMMHLDSQRSYDIDGPETVFTTKLAPGNYGVVLTFGEHHLEPHLVRTVGNVDTVVRAIWTDTQPFSFDITAGNTTSVTLHFDVPGFGDVTFNPGTLNVDVAVQNTVSTVPSSIAFAATLTPGTVSFGANHPSAETVFAATQGETRHAYLALTPDVGAQWYLDLDSACLDVRVTESHADPGEDTFAARLEHVENGPAKLCVSNAPNGADSISLIASADGSLPPAQASFFPAGSYDRYLRFDGQPTVDVFDGTTLDQAALGQGIQITSGVFQHSIYQTTPNTEVTFMVGSFGPATLKLTP